MAPKPKYNAHPDACQARLIEIWRTAGLRVEIDDKEHYDVSIFGYERTTGFGFWLKVEIKTTTGKLTRAQRDFQAEWPHAVMVVYDDPDPVLREYGMID